MNHPSKHLSDEALSEILLKGNLGDNATKEHLASCSQCGAEAQAMVDELEGFASLRSAPDKRCPDVRVWHEVALGLGDEKEGAKYVEHASICSDCGAALKRASELLSADASEEEEHQVETLRTAGSVWQARFADQMKLSPEDTAHAPNARWWLSLRILVASFTSAAVVVVCAIFLFRPSPSKTIASAYAEQRVLDMRLAGAPYAPLMAQQRGAQLSLVDRPKLADAISAVSKEPRSSVAFIADEGRLDLLSLRTDEAIAKLSEANRKDTAAVAIMNDLGAAYAERALLANRPEDFGSAVEWFTRALKQDPTDAAALYNRALAYQKLYVYEAAEKDWRAYIAAYPSDTWTPSAREYLAQIEDLKKSPEASLE